MGSFSFVKDLFPMKVFLSSVRGLLMKKRSSTSYDLEDSMKGSSSSLKDPNTQMPCFAFVKDLLLMQEPMKRSFSSSSPKDLNKPMQGSSFSSSSPKDLSSMKGSFFFFLKDLMYLMR